MAAAAELGVWMVNVHASGGARMMTAAREALLPFGKDAPLLIAVTVLTSMESSDLQDLGITLSPADYAAKLAALTQRCGLEGWCVQPRRRCALSMSWGRRLSW